MRANREQVDRVREVPDGSDFYAPVRSLFRADPTRTDDPGPGRPPRPGPTRATPGSTSARAPADSRCRSRERWPRRVGRSSPWMRRHRCSRRCARSPPSTRSRTSGRSRRAGRRPSSTEVAAVRSDAVLIAHVGYDIEAIGPFVDALEAAARRELVAVLMDRAPASAADPFWPLVHGEIARPAPGAGRLRRAAASPWQRTVSSSGSTSRHAASRRVMRSKASFASSCGSIPQEPSRRSSSAALDELAVPDGDGWTIRGRGPVDVGIVQLGRTERTRDRDARSGLVSARVAAAARPREARLALLLDAVLSGPGSWRWSRGWPRR